MGILRSETKYEYLHFIQSKHSIFYKTNCKSNASIWCSKRTQFSCCVISKYVRVIYSVTEHFGRIAMHIVTYFCLKPCTCWRCHIYTFKHATNRWNVCTMLHVPKELYFVIQNIQHLNSI